HLGDPGGVRRQELGGEVAEGPDHARLDQLHLLLQVWTAGIDLLRLRVAVPGRAAVVYDTPSGDEIVCLLDIDTEKRRVLPRLLSYVFDFNLIEHDSGGLTLKPRWIEVHALLDIRMELVTHRRGHIRRDLLAQLSRRRHVEIEPATRGFRGKPEPAQSAK